MTVSDKMFESAHANLYAYIADIVDPYDVEKIIQDGVDAAWIIFDPKDKTTWPKGKYTPTGERWLCCLKGMGGYYVACCAKDAFWENVVAYMDPINILPGFIGDNR